MAHYETYDDDDDDDEVEVERPKTPPKPREPVPPPPKQEVVVVGGEPGKVLVPEMPDSPEESPPASSPREAQAQNDRQVSDLFARAKGGKVIQMRRRGGVGETLSPQATTHVVTSNVTNQAALDAQRAAEFAAQKAAAAKAAQAAAQQAQQQAQQAVRTLQTTAQPAPEPQQQADTQPAQPYRVPVRPRSNPLVLLGVAAAALVGAVAFSMMIAQDEGEEEEEDGSDSELDVPRLADYPEPPEVIEGEIVEDEDEGEEEEAEPRKTA